MVYQFLFDIFLFDTQFSELQYWGIGVTVITFALDIFLTIKPAIHKSSEEIEEQGEKSFDEQPKENERASLARIKSS